MNKSIAVDISNLRLREFMRHNMGWYADVDCELVFQGQVWRLSGGRFVVGYFNPEGEYYSLDGKIYWDDLDAARAADAHAKYDAQRCREYSGAVMAKCNAESKVNGAYIECRKLLNLFRAQRKTGPMCEELVDDMTQQWEAAREVSRAALSHLKECRKAVRDLIGE